MQKLIIQDIVQLNAYTYGICFHGAKKPFHAMNGFLRRQSRNKVYWSSTVFDEKGGWIIRLDFLRRISAHFENTERALVIADRAIALKKMRMLTEPKPS